MALKTENVYNPTSSTQEFAFTFPYRQESDIKVTHDREDVTFTLPNATTVRLDTAISSGELRIWRETNTDTSPSTFYPGSTIKSADLNDNFEQVLYCAEELKERYVDQRGVKSISKDLRFEGSTANAFETILSVTDPTVRDQTYRLPNIPTNNTSSGAATNGIYDIITTGTPSVDLEGDLNVAGNFEVTGTSLHTGQQTVPGGAQVKNIKVGLDAPNEVGTTSGNLVLDSATGTVQVDDSMTVAGTLTVTGTTILAADSIGTSEIADLAVTTAKIANTSITNEKMTANSITTSQIQDGQITTAKIANTSITNEKMAADAITTSNIQDGQISTAKIADTSITNTKMASNAITTSQIQDGQITTVKIADSNVTTAKLATGAVNVDKLANNSINSDKIANNAVTADKIADAAIITNAEATAGITADDVTFFTTSAADYRYFRQDSTETIGSGNTWSGVDNKIATTGAIDARIVDLVDDVGGFVPIANETSFPNTNPDINDGAGTLVSIKTLASNHTSNGSGVISISNGTVGNSTVTINGAANSTTYSAGYGMIVETTATLNTYTFHRLVPKATEVTTVAGKATEIGRLGTAAAVEDLGILGTTAVVEDMGLLGTTACVADMALLGDSAVIADMATIADTSNLIANIGTVAGIQANVTTVAGNNSNVTTVATNINSVNDFAARYRVASSAPSSSLDVGDLYFDTSVNELKVYNGSAWQGGVTATGSFAVVTGNTFTGSNTYNDSVKAIFGTGSDLEIYHDGSNSVIKESGTGDFRIQTASFRLRNEDASEMMISADADGAVYLAHNGTTKLETTAAGATVTGTLTATLGTASQTSITSVGTLTGLTVSGDFTLDNGSNAGNDLYWDASADQLVFKDNVYAKFGNGGDLAIWHNGSHSYIKDQGSGILSIQSDGTEIVLATSGGESMGRFLTDGAVELYHDGTKKFETISGGVTVTGDCYVTGDIDMTADDKGVKFGNDDDFLIKHTGSHAILDNDTGDTYIKAAGMISLNPANTEDGLLVKANGACELYYDNSKKFETISTGITVTGNCYADAFYLGDSEKSYWGIGDDLQIYHDGSNSYIQNTNNATTLIAKSDYFHVDENQTGDHQLRCRQGVVELYHNGVKTFETNTGGATLYGIEGGEARFFLYADEGDDNADKWRIESDTAGNFNIHNLADGSWDRSIACAGSGNVELFYDDSKKIETTSSGITVTGNCTASSKFRGNDDVKVSLGDGEDLQIYHDGTNSYVKNWTGQLKLTATSSEDGIVINPNGAVKLYHDGTEMFETMANGVRSQNGILFGTDTATANRLSDYEEGTWTPSLDFNSNSCTYHANTGGSYVKIGKHVTCYGYIQITAATRSNDWILGGLPFAAGDHSSGSSAVEGGLVTTHIDNCSATTIFGKLEDGDSSLYLRHQISSGNGSAVASSEIDTTFVWGFILNYMSA